jgi:hypothetical protein
MTKYAEDFEEDEPCPFEGCEGLLQFGKPVNCSCHISPPCHACTEAQLTCGVCGWEVEDLESYNGQ